LLVLALLLGATLAACGSNASSGGVTAGSSSRASSVGSGSTRIPAALTIGSSQKILTLDPDLAADGYSEGIVHLIGGNLYELEADKQVRPQLAAAGRASGDGLTWTFQLRAGLRFSDGTPLTSQDVKDTIERAKRDRENVYGGFVAPIARIDAPSPTTVVMHLSRPYPSLPVVLSQPEMTILPSQGLAKGKSFFDAPVSAGPYKLQSWGGSPRATLVRNPSYAGSAPAVKRLTFQTIDDFNARYAQVQSGQLDFATDIPSRLLAHPPAGTVGGLTAHYGFITLPLNVNSKPLDEVGVRQAIAKAIDRSQLDQVVWNGGLTPIADFWPSTMSGYDKSISTARDVAGAKAALRGTSCERGCTVHMMYSAANPWAEPTATIVAQNLKDVGITVKLEKLDDPTFNQRLGDIHYQIAESFLYDYNDVPDGMLTYAMTADGGLNANFTGWKPGADVQRAVEQAITQGGAARTQALAEVNRLFLKYQPFITLSDYAVGSISRYAPSVVKTNEAGFVDAARKGA